MKPKTAHSVISTIRCCYRSPTGRQCRVLTSDTRSGLCAQHRAEDQQKERADVYDPLSRNSQGFQTAQGVNHSLHNLYWLLAKNRISPRRAAVLAYINSLLLRTLPAIDSDQAAGIIDPDAPPVPELTGTGETTDEVTEDTTETGPETESSNTAAAVTKDSTDSWDSSLPEPDPTKKPS